MYTALHTLHTFYTALHVQIAKNYGTQNNFANAPSTDLHPHMVHALRRIAKQMMEKFPHTFEDRIRGKRYGKGFDSLQDSLKDGNNYLNRSEIQRPPSNKKKVEARIVKLKIQARMGSSNWEPETYPPEVTMETIIVKRNLLREHFMSLTVGESANEILHEEIITLLKATYKMQRNFFNNFDEPPTTENLNIFWPILLRKEYMFYLYELLICHPIKVIEINFLQEKDRIFHYGRQSNLTDADSPEDYDILDIIAKHFKEEHLMINAPVSFLYSIIFF